MKILLVSATRKELHPVKKAIRASFPQTNGIEFYFLSVGIGLRNSAMVMTNNLSISVRYDLAINFGLAGSLSPQLNVGDVFFPTSFHAFQNGAIKSVNPINTSNRVSDGLPETWIRGGLFSSEKPIVSTEQKSSVVSASGALAVDMEAFALLESCRRADIPFISLKIISDQADSTAIWTFFRKLNKNLAVLSVETMRLIRHILKQTESIYGRSG